MKTYIKTKIISTIRAMGFDVIKVQKRPYSIFVEDIAHIAKVSHEGQSLKFFVGNPDDHIQKTHLTGSLYELEELAIIKKHYIPGTAFVDIGTNVGNHALWAAACLGAPRVVGFEPVLGQHTLACANVALNGLNDQVQIRKLALSSQQGRTHIARSFVISNSSGSASVSHTSLGEEVLMSTGDQELSDIGPFFLKIDVEGHEMHTLDGLTKTIQTFWPNIFIEVGDENQPAFQAWIKANGYKILEDFRRHKRNCNFALAPNR